MHLSETDLLKEQIQVLKDSAHSLRNDLEEVAMQVSESARRCIFPVFLTDIQRDLLAGDNEKQSEMLQDLQFQVKELAELEAQSTVENAAIQKQSTHTLQRLRSKLDPCTLIFCSFFLHR